MSSSSLEFDQQAFLTLLKQLISFSAKLQNNPPEHVPQEELVVDAVMKFLEPVSQPHGPLAVKKFLYRPGRANLMVTYAGTDKSKVVSFVGAHMDVVPANPEEWERNPFELVQDGDKLYARGVTDCLGHVAVLAVFLKQLALANASLKRSVVVVFIANEENSDELGIGIDQVQKDGHLEHLKQGPLYWIDSANFGPTLGTGGMASWQLTVTGRKFHSGFPHKGINSIELAHQVVSYIQKRFYEDFTGYAAEEKKYLFQIGSSIKPTQISTPPGSLNQIPGYCTVSGDIRFTPFYNYQFVESKMAQYVKELDVSTLPSHGASKYHLPEENLKGAVELKWLGHPYKGVAVNMESAGYKALYAAIEKACGEAKPFSLTGSLPIIRDLQDSGFDVQITGFGRMDAYHANNEFGLLSDFGKGFQVLSHIVSSLDAQ